MTAQTSISRLPSAAIAGMVAASDRQEVDSRALSTSAGVDAGVLIVEGATPGEVGALPTNAGTLAFPVGFSIFQVSKEATSPNYKQYDMVPCLRKGRIWLKCEGTISDGETALFINHTTGLPTETDDGTTTPLPAGHFIKCIKGNTNGLLGLFAIDFP